MIELPQDRPLPGPDRRDELYAAYLERDRLLSGGTIGAVSWAEETQSVTVIYEESFQQHIARLSLIDGAIDSRTSIAGIRDALAVALGVAARDLAPIGGLALSEPGVIDFTYGGAPWRFTIDTGTVGRLQTLTLGQKWQGAVTDGENDAPRMWKRRYCGGYLVDAVDVPELPSPRGDCLASVRNHNIVLRFTGDGRELPLTRCGTPDIHWDIDSIIIGRSQGRLDEVAVRQARPWSPDGLALLAYRRDISSVFRIPRIHWLQPFEEVDLQAFQKAGAALDRVEPFIIDVRNGRQVAAQIDMSVDHYVQWLDWLPGEKEAALIVYSRDIRRVDIFAVCRATGAVRTLLSESSDSPVKIQQDEVWSSEHGFRLLPDGSGFLWLSSRDGWTHLYSYDFGGRCVGQLTQGSWSVYEIAQIADGFAYLTAAVDTARPYDLHVCRVPLSGGEIDQLTHEQGIHTASFAPGTGAFLDRHSAIDRPHRVDLVRVDGTHLATVCETDVERLIRLGYRAPEEFTVKATDGITDLWGVIYKPADFDPGRSYPVIEYIYAGPQVIFANRSFPNGTSSRWMNLAWALAQRGYIVICLDARGTPGRSKAFQDFIQGELEAGLADHVAAVAQLCDRHSWMDADRVGIYGGSWGGSYSTAALIDYPDTYRAAVSFEPSYDPWHSIMYEPYLGLPQDNRAAYEAADVIARAKNLRRPLMIISGTSYNPCVATAFRMTRALIDAGIDHEFVLVPGGSHAFGGRAEDYLCKKLVGWFDRHIGEARVSGDVQA